MRMVASYVCKGSGRKSDSWPGDRDQCRYCGRIALTRKDGTYAMHSMRGVK